ncbi:hypothetical protein LTR91_022423 [Friedmanniomyces endolithicus]|uniref:C2H2-type domain-containing protein n=1 Tax=Friedmanniomyces endolithicus TaxID=329885 RepID=A0AAN6HAV5_9PEZI|nr:hypothetical protein LTR57_015513 [Friedmanniomyces endolithicus]KAK0956359.1 hypothetical protein LTR91_022423 [Friedmanniomyces endolithicus]KAK0974741.1 hypothetical protein LTS01_014068 [Friedmanniomyces endolithicus]KAK1035678.1 hypothetical protein LTS16_014353 [Friedmanniomyces endolithicus]
MDSKDHWAYDFKCETCDDQYRTRAAVDEHMAKNGHWKNYCSDCDRHFQSESNYRAHRNSRLHLGRSIPCPFCRAAHTTASGLLHHLETASCPHARTLNRDRILQIVRERDPHHLITNKQIGWHAEDYLQRHGRRVEWVRMGVLSLPPRLRDRARAGPAFEF